MENKKYIICLFAVICICFLLIGYFNYEKVIKFFDEKEWEFAESFATLKIENISQVDGGKPLLILTNNKLELYDNAAKSKYVKEMVKTGLITNSCEDYLVLVTKDTNEIYLFKDTELLWNNVFNWNILNVSVNKNGYVTVIYSQGGYKSSIKIFKPTGEELFTTYLASTYALDVEMSNDNKTLYIAEIDTEGIKIKSNIKIIEVTNIETSTNDKPKVQTVLVGTDELITDIEYAIDKLIVLKDTGIIAIDKSRNVEELGNFEVKNMLFANISGLKYPIAIEKVATGIFTNETLLKIFKEEIVEVKLEKTPQSVETSNNIIALNLGDEIIFFNINGKVQKRYELENQLISIKLYDKGNVAALIFRDRVELVKI